MNHHHVSAEQWLNETIPSGFTSMQAEAVLCFHSQPSHFLQSAQEKEAKKQDKVFLLARCRNVK